MARIRVKHGKRVLGTLTDEPLMIQTGPRICRWGVLLPVGRRADKQVERTHEIHLDRWTRVSGIANTPMLDDTPMPATDESFAKCDRVVFAFPGFTARGEKLAPLLDRLAAQGITDVTLDFLTRAISRSGAAAARRQLPVRHRA